MNKVYLCLFFFYLFGMVCGDYVPASTSYSKWKFDWTYINHYGDVPGTNILNLPYDFILSQDGNSLVVVERRANVVKMFTKNAYNNITVLFNLPSSYNTTLLSVEQINKNAFVVGAENATFVWRQNLTLTNLVTPSPVSNVEGLFYDIKTSTLYLTDYNQLRLLALNVTDLPLSYLVQLYSKIGTSKQTYNGIYHSRLDCFGNLWIADTYRILRFPVNSTVADLVWGQPNFTSTNGQYSQNTFNFTSDLVFTNKCEAAFIADTTRVLRFDAPFTSNQSADGVLGATNFNSAGTFSQIKRIQLEDNGNNTGQLYIIDYSNNRIVVGRTSWNAPTLSTSPSTSTSASPSPSTSARPSDLVCNGASSSISTCIVQQPVSIQSSTVSFNYSVTVIQGSLSIDDSSTVIIGSTQQVQTSGNIILSGRLLLAVSEDSLSSLQTQGSLFITLFTTNETISGQFSSIEVQNKDVGCGSQQETKYSERSMGVLLTQNTGCGGGGDGLSKGAIAGIVIGVVGGVIVLGVLIAGGVALGLYVMKNKKRDRVREVNL